MITEKDVLSARKWIALYTARAEMYEARAKTCKPEQRGAFRSHAAQRRKDVVRWIAHYDYFMGRLVGENYELYLKLKKSENTM